MRYDEHWNAGSPAGGHCTAARRRSSSRSIMSPVGRACRISRYATVSRSPLPARPWPIASTTSAWRRVAGSMRLSCWAGRALPPFRSTCRMRCGSWAARRPNTAAIPCPPPTKTSTPMRSGISPEAMTSCAVITACLPPATTAARRTRTDQSKVRMPISSDGSIRPYAGGAAAISSASRPGASSLRRRSPDRTGGMLRASMQNAGCSRRCPQGEPPISPWLPSMSPATAPSPSIGLPIRCLPASSDGASTRISLMIASSSSSVRTG